MQEQTLPAGNPRDAARQLVRESVPKEQWSESEAFTHGLVRRIEAHRLFTHPVLETWRRKEFTRASMRIVHAEVRVALAEHFTDALIRCMQTTGTLERRLGAKAKMASRFLIQLNVLEELGFKPSPVVSQEFHGHPGFSHYWQLVDTLAALGEPEEHWARYEPSPASLAIRETLLGTFNDHLRLATIVAAIETAFVPYYTPWALNTVAVAESDISDGYHSIHVEDETGSAVDEDHSEDSWFIVRQALTTERHAEIELFLSGLLDQWANWIDMFVVKDAELKRSA